MQNRVSTNPLDRVTGLVYLCMPGFIPIYDAEQSPADAWEILVDAMNPRDWAELLFFYPEPGNGKRCWRPSWQQAMMNSIIVDDISIQSLSTVSRTGQSRRRLVHGLLAGCRIESGDMRGLGEVPKEEKCRQGQLVLKDMTGHLAQSELWLTTNTQYRMARIPSWAPCLHQTIPG